MQTIERCKKCGRLLYETDDRAYSGGHCYCAVCVPPPPRPSAFDGFLQTEITAARVVAVGGVLGSICRFIAQFYFWIILIGLGTAIPPLGMLLMLGYAIVRWIAWEFARAHKRG